MIGAAAGRGAGLACGGLLAGGVALGWSGGNLGLAVGAAVGVPFAAVLWECGRALVRARGAAADGDSGGDRGRQAA